MLTPLREELGEAVAFARSIGEVPRNPSAKALWHAVYPVLTGERAGLSGALAARATAHVLRLSLLFALLECSAVIDPAHLMAAVALWDYCERCTTFLFGERTGNPLADDVGELLRAAPGGLSRAELVSALGRHQYGDKLTAALVVLETAGLATREKLATGGKPAEHWRATHRTGTESPLMDVARNAFSATVTCEQSDESNQSPDLERLDRFQRTCTVASRTPVDPLDDLEQFDAAMKADGMTWPQVLKWLNAPATFGMFQVSKEERHRAYRHLTRNT